LAALRTEQDPPFRLRRARAYPVRPELTRTADARDTREALAEHFCSEQIVEITLIVAMATSRETDSTTAWNEAEA